MTENQNLTFFYKYRPLIDDTKSNGINENTLKLLEHGELYFSKPSNFNDPFDCKIEYHNVDLKDIEVICKKKNISKQKTSEFVENFLKNPQSIYTLLLEQKQKDFLNIFCLAKDDKNILMWSHYAKNHTGICIGFKSYFVYGSHVIKTKENYINSNYAPAKIFNNSDYIILIPIEYNKKIPAKYNISKGDSDILFKFVTNKALDWQYEKEYRAIIADTYIIKNPICIEKTEIGEILFGIKTPEYIKEKIIDIIKTYPDPKPNVYKCVYTEGQYAISKEKIEL